MKKNTIIIVLAIAVVMLSAFIATDQKTGKIMNYEGYDIYKFSEPTADYEIVDTINPYGGMMKVYHDVEMVRPYTSRAKKYGEKKGERIDGLIFTGKDNETLYIRYK